MNTFHRPKEIIVMTSGSEAARTIWWNSHVKENACRLLTTTKRKSSVNPAWCHRWFVDACFRSLEFGVTAVVIAGSDHIWTRRGGAREHILTWSDWESEDTLCHLSYSKCDHNLRNQHRTVLKKMIQTINSSGNQLGKKSGHFLIRFYTIGPFIKNFSRPLLIVHSRWNK